MLAAIDYPEDLETHLERTIIRTESGIDLIPCNKRVADAAARLQVMQMSQYNAMGAEDRACEKVLAVITDILRTSYGQCPLCRRLLHHSGAGTLFGK